MTVIELARLIEEMRTAQKTYFRTRLPADLQASKDLERRVDVEARNLLRGPTLFDREATK